MNVKSIILAADHNGIELKSALYNTLKLQGYQVMDLGPYNTSSVDYVDYAYQVGRIIDKGDADRGILICGTGVGMSIAANRFKNVRAALIHNLDSAPRCREHNDSNVLCLGSWITPPKMVEGIVTIWLNCKFGEGRHVKRVEKLSGPKPQTVVFTNGIYDILHAGHIEQLKFAKSLGDKLVVGINSDESTRRLKGPERPINTQQDRKKLLQSLQEVDEVVIFEEPRTNKIVRKVNPDIVVKGADYTVDEIRANDSIPDHIDIKVFPLLNKEKYSTTSVVDKIKSYVQ